MCVFVVLILFCVCFSGIFATALTLLFRERKTFVMTWTLHRQPSPSIQSTCRHDLRWISCHVCKVFWTSNLACKLLPHSSMYFIDKLRTVLNRQAQHTRTPVLFFTTTCSQHRIDWEDFLPSYGDLTVDLNYVTLGKGRGAFLKYAETQKLWGCCHHGHQV